MVDADKNKKGFRSLFKKKGKKAEEGAKDVKKVVAKAADPKPVTKPSATIKKEVPVNHVPKPTVAEDNKGTKKKGSWLSQTKYFRDLSNWAFDVVDTDGSGCVDEKELYSGLLLIHLKLGSFAGPAACKPVERDRVHEIFLKRDADHSGSLDREEFKGVMSVLCGNIFTRVLAQWSLTLMIVPMVAQYILNFVTWVIGTGWDTLSEMDDYESLESMVCERFDDLSETVIKALPDKAVIVFSRIGRNLVYIGDMIPESIWNTIPVTLISCILSCIAVPFIILSIDDYFQSLADKKKSNQRAEI